MQEWLFLRKDIDDGCTAAFGSDEASPKRTILKNILTEQLVSAYNDI
ncbi:hypothetical protein [Peribacillus frigoritolerans]|nr:hypothetical protein [Peribacillus frigoritolerans]